MTTYLIYGFTVSSAEVPLYVVCIVLYPNSSWTTRRMVWFSRWSHIFEVGPNLVCHFACCQTSGGGGTEVGCEGVHNSGIQFLASHLESSPRENLHGEKPKQGAGF